MELRREIHGVHGAMRCVDHHRTDGFRSDTSDAVGDDDRSGRRCGPVRGDGDPASCKQSWKATIEAPLDVASWWFVRCL
jgi:hypothetical protein